MVDAIRIRSPMFPNDSLFLAEIVNMKQQPTQTTPLSLRRSQQPRGFFPSNLQIEFQGSGG